MRTYKVGYFVGSLSSTSINRTLSRALIRLAPDDLEFTELPIGDLPLYSPDFDSAYPAEPQALKDAIADSDAVLFVTPEYNRSIPGALKNAIDWASRPWGQNWADARSCSSSLTWPSVDRSTSRPRRTQSRMERRPTTTCTQARSSAGRWSCPEFGRAHSCDRLQDRMFGFRGRSGTVLSSAR